MPAPRMLVGESVRSIVPGARDLVPDQRLARAAVDAAEKGEKVLIAARGAWRRWLEAAEEAWSRGLNHFLLEAVDTWEAEAAGLGYAQLVVARAAYQARRPAEKVSWERPAWGARLSRRALLRGAARGLLVASERPVETSLCGTAGVGDACRLCVERCSGAACSASQCSAELLEVPGYSREGLQDFLRVVGPRPSGFLVFTSRWGLADLGEQLSSPRARAYIVPVMCPYTVGLEELLAARALGLEPVIVEHPGAGRDPRCGRREDYLATVAGDYKRLTGQELLVAGPREAAERLRGAPEAPEPVEGAAGLLSKGLHSLAVAELDRLARGQPVETLLTARVVVYGDRCTLCGACSQECPTDALSLRRREGAEELLFLPGRCISCGYCVAICPEDAMAVVHEAPPRPGEWATLAREEAVRCLGCGRPVAPRSLVASVARKMLAAGLPRRALVTLVLCEECRVRYQLGALKLDEERALRMVREIAGLEGEDG